jgi:serine protease Do
MRIRWQLKFPIWLALCLALADALSQEAPANPAGAVFEQVKPALLQVRVNLLATRTLSSSGSGFLVSADGRVVTNYHVVSAVALEPDQYELVYLRPDGSSGPLQIVALDVVNDLALLRMQGDDLPHLSLRREPVAKGQQGYALGYPLNVGLTISQGTYNGLVTPAHFNDLIHFTGAINSGMSGGPAVTRQGEVFGVNVAVLADGQLVSFLVPVRFVAGLLEGADGKPPAVPDDLRAEVNGQLLAYQDRLAETILGQPMVTRDIGKGYSVPTGLTGFFNCGSGKEEGKNRYFFMEILFCSSESELYVSNRISLAYLTFTHSLIYSDRLNPFRFAALYADHFAAPEAEAEPQVGAFACTEDLVASGSSRLRAVLCQRQYRKLDGLYDFALKTATLNEPDTGLKSTLLIVGFSHENGVRLARRFLEGMTWQP